MSVFYSDSLDFLDKRTKRILAEMRESFVPHTPYQYEKNMLTAVKNGDLAEAEKCTRLLDTTGKGGVMSSDPLQQAQIHLISHITLITRAALEAGVTEDLAYAMSDSYIQIAQGCTSPKQLMQLRDRSVRDFTGAVMHLKNSPPCSKSIRAAINYMHRHRTDACLLLKQMGETPGTQTGSLGQLIQSDFFLEMTVHIVDGSSYRL